MRYSELLALTIEAYFTDAEGKPCTLNMLLMAIKKDPAL